MYGLPMRQKSPVLGLTMREEAPVLGLPMREEAPVLGLPRQESEMEVWVLSTTSRSMREPEHSSKYHPGWFEASKKCFLLKKEPPDSDL